MKQIVEDHNHLRLEGNETTEELRTALAFMVVDHPSSMCRWPQYAIPIETLIPDITELLTVKSGDTRPVKNVDIHGERL